jgi:general secretion pathway protein G
MGAMEVVAHRRTDGGNQGGRGRGRLLSRGFTLIEMLVVMGIAAILMAIVVPSYVGMARQHRQAVCAANLKAIGRALAIFHEDYGCYPPDCTEYLWTPEAMDEWELQRQMDPRWGEIPGDHRLGTLTGAAYYPLDFFKDTPPDDRRGKPFAPRPDFRYYNSEERAVRGRGLLTLYYVGAYAAVLPPITADPRFTNDLYLNKTLDPQHGFNQFGWFRGSGYITKLDTYHCPENDTTYTKADLTTNTELPSLGQLDPATDEWHYWNNYDAKYRRNEWVAWGSDANPGAKPGPYDDKRNLWEAYPPVDTVVTWCAFHRRGEHHVQPRGPQGPHAGDKGGGGFYHPPADKSVVTGDKDLVLFVDGSVRRMTSREDNKMYDASVPDAGWPEGPVM